jgi:hypothetical protein
MLGHSRSPASRLWSWYQSYPTTRRLLGLRGDLRWNFRLGSHYKRERRGLTDGGTMGKRLET